MNKEIKAVPELIARKRKLEKDIGSCVHQLVEDFKTETGISPKSIDINFIEATKISSFYPEYTLARVYVDLSLE